MSSQKIKYPFVSICTPTFNRRPFFPILFEMFKLQTYPIARMEWIILDDGTDPIKDLVDASGIEQIKYIRVEQKMTLGAKRNLIHTYCIGSIIVYVDDDDYLPPERVEHSVNSLVNAKNKELIAGSSEIYLYFKDNGLYQFGPYGPNHATAGTFAFKREILNLTKYDDNACLAEERVFLKDYSFPMIQLDPLKTILVIPHSHNTFDKHTLLHNNDGSFKLSNKTIDDFIVGLNTTLIKNFFTNKIHLDLNDYNDGLPIMKPDVILQTKQLEIERKRFIEQQQQQQQQQQPIIMIKRPGQPDITLNNQEVVHIMQEQQKLIVKLTEKNNELQDIILQLQHLAITSKPSL